MKALALSLLLVASLCGYGQVYKVDSLLKEKQMSRFYLLKDTVSGETVVKTMDYRGAARKRSFIGKLYLVSYVNEKRIFKLIK